MANTKPYVAAAVFCENLLEQEGGVMTVVRIIDTYIVQVPGNVPKDTLPGIMVNGLIAMKSGDLIGTFMIGLVLENPLGERQKLGEWPVVLKGGEHGVQLKLQFPLGVKNFGLCWFDVLFGDEVLTRIPLKLQQAEPPVESPSSS